MNPDDSIPPVAEIYERPLRTVAGHLVLPVGATCVVAAAVLLIFAVRDSVHPSGGQPGLWAGFVVLVASAAVALRGLTRLAPGDALVVQFWGKYMGSLRTPGLWWINPASRRRTVSTRLRIHQGATLKVNDADGIPVEAALTLTWRVSDTARAVFAVQDVERFVTAHGEMVLRRVVAEHRYGPDGTGSASLSTSPARVDDTLTDEIGRRVEAVGVTVTDAQIVRLSYAREIAGAMLRRQEAAAIIDARQQIVDGAVGMVELALERLEAEHVVDLDEERKATMVSDLLVVLCSDHGTQPMINAGSLYL